MSLEGKDAHDRSVNLNMRLYSDPAFDWVMAGTTDLFNHHEFTTNYPASSLDLEAIRQEEHNVRRDSSAYSLDPGPYRMEYATAEKLNQLEGCSPGSDLAKFPTDWSDAKQTQPPGYCHYYTHILDPLFHWKVPEQSCQPKDRERQVHHSDHSFFPLDETDAEQKDQAHTDNSYSLLSSMQCGPPAPLSSMSPSTNLGTSGFSSLLNGHTPYATSSPSLGLVSDHQSPFSASSNVLKDEADFLGSTEEVFSTARPTTLAGFNTYSSHFTGEDELDQYLSTAGTLLKSVSTVDPAVDNFQVVYNNKELWVQALYDVMIEVPSDIPKKTKIALRKKAVDQVRMEATAFQLVRRVLSLHNPVEGIRVFSSSDLALVKQADTRLTCSERLEYIRAALKVSSYYRPSL